MRQARQATQKSKKKKHSNDDEFEASSDSDSSSSSSSSSSPSSSSDDDMTVPKRRERQLENRRTKKKGKSKAKSTRPVNRENNIEEETEEEDSSFSNGDLFEIVKNKLSYGKTVNAWRKNYKENSNLATVELLNFVIKSSGNSGSIDEEILISGEIEKVLDALTAINDFQEEGGEYPIISRKKEFKRFPKSFIEFWDALIQRCSADIIFDEFFMDVLISWLTEISSSKVRPFRHTATLAGLQIVRSLIVVASNLRQEFEIKQRQSRTQSKKGNEEACHQLNETAKRLNQNYLRLEELMEEIFRGIFVHRYRDAFPGIRCICVEALGHWISEYPTFFLEDKYLKYVGWTMFDKVGEVRLSAIKSLKLLYSNKDLVTQINAFTERFKKRFLELCFDTEIEVAFEGLHLTQALANLDALEPEEMDKIYQLISDESASIRDGAADFINERYFKVTVVDLVNDSRKKRDETTNKPSIELRAVLDFIKEKTLHPFFPNYFVDAMFSKLKILRDWDSMLKLLLSDEVSLSDSDVTLLIHVLNCAVKKSQGVPIVAQSKIQRSTTRPKKERESFTTVMMTSLNELFIKYGVDPVKLEDLAEFPQMMNIVDYHANHLQKNFEELLVQMSKHYLTHSQEAVLSNLALSWKHLNDTEDHFGKAKIQQAFSQLLDALEKRLQDLSDNTLSPQLLLTQDEEEEHSLFACLERIKCLYHYFNLNVEVPRLNEKVWSMLASLEQDSENFPRSVGSAISISFQHILWSYQEIQVDYDDTKAQHLIEVRDRYINKILGFLNFDGSSLTSLGFIVYLKLCDLLTLFSPLLKNFKNDDERQLVKLEYKIDPSLQERMIDFFVQALNAKDEDTGPKEDREEFKEQLIGGMSKVAYLHKFGIKGACLILLQFVKHSKRITDIVKTFLGNVREVLGKDEHLAIMETLRKQFEICMEELIVAEKKAKRESEDGSSSQSREEGSEEEPVEESIFREERVLKPLRELAARLASSYGIGKPLEKHRQTIFLFTQRALEFAFSDFPDKLPFFHALVPFASKLTVDILKIYKKTQEFIAKYNIDITSVQQLPLGQFVQTIERLARLDNGIFKVPDTPSGKSRAKAKAKAKAKSKAKRGPSKAQTKLNFTNEGRHTSLASELSQSNKRPLQQDHEHEEEEQQQHDSGITYSRDILAAKSSRAPPSPSSPPRLFEEEEEEEEERTPRSKTKQGVSSLFSRYRQPASPSPSPLRESSDEELIVQRRPVLARSPSLERGSTIKRKSEGLGLSTYSPIKPVKRFHSLEESPSPVKDSGSMNSQELIFDRPAIADGTGGGRWSISGSLALPVPRSPPASPSSTMDVEGSPFPSPILPSKRLSVPPPASPGSDSEPIVLRRNFLL